MWFVFILPVVVASGVAALFTVTTGMNFVIFAMGTAEWQRRRGYRTGEGRLSERENDMYYGVGMDAESDHDISMGLGRLAATAPTAFAPYINKRYDFTKTEGTMLRSILMPAIATLDDVEALKIQLEEDPTNQDILYVLGSAVDLLAKLIHPITTYLQQFPEKRIKSV